MPSVHAMDIVNKLFSGSKDLSAEVDDAMKAMSADALEQKRKEIASDFLKPEEETTDETDHGTD
jgi:hypothetical protein